MPMDLDHDCLFQCRIFDAAASIGPSAAGVSISLLFGGKGCGVFEVVSIELKELLTSLAKAYGTQ